MSDNKNKFNENKWLEMIHNIAVLLEKKEYAGTEDYIDDCIYQLNTVYRIIDQSYVNKLLGMKLPVEHFHTGMVLSLGDGE